jgi:hypothetical protein
MKQIKYLIAAALCVATMLPTKTAAKIVVAPKVYMFGFAASFNDTIVHFTDIQTVSGVDMEKKSKFLVQRESYSAQLRNYLAEQQMPYRTCMVFYDTNMSKLQKKYVKMKRLYTGVGKKGRKAKNSNDIRLIDSKDFKFKAVVDEAAKEE